MAARANVPPFHVMDLLARGDERQRTHGDLVNLRGRPADDRGAGAGHAPRRSGCSQSDDPLGYTPAAAASPSCASAIAEHHRRPHGIDVTADDVVVTTGS